MALWSLRNYALYNRFLFSQVTDFNMAFFNYPAMLARETGRDEWVLRDSLMRDFGQEVFDRGISGDDRAKTALLVQRVKEATGYIMARPADYLICHLSYLPRALGTLNPPMMKPQGPVHAGPAPGPPGGFSVAGIVNVAARAVCFLLAIPGILFWWRRKKSQAAGLIAGSAWLILSMGPAGDDRTSLPAVVFASVLAQGGWLIIKDWVKVRLKSSFKTKS